ncbi:MAG: tetratricopeptide repeat protein [Elusimicrobiota bacterium]
MRSPRILLAACLLSGCAAAGRVFSDDALRETEAVFAAGGYPEVIARLGEGGVQKLPRRSRAAAYHLLGQSYLRTGESVLALQTYKVAEGLHPKDLTILTDLADLLRSAGLADLARPYYERVLDIHPGNAVSHVGLALVFREYGNLAKAQEHYELALREWDRNPVLLKGYAEVLADRGDLAAATRAIRRSLDLQVEPDALVCLARLQRRQGAKAESYASLADAALREPRRAEWALQRGLWLLEDGRFDEARELADRLIELDAASPLARWLRASIAMRRGQLAAAEEDLAAAAASRDDPFTARVAGAMLELLEKP